MESINDENKQWLQEIKADMEKLKGKPIIRKEWDILHSRLDLSKYYRFFNNFKSYFAILLNWNDLVNN